MITKTEPVGVPSQCRTSPPFALASSRVMNSPRPVPPTSGAVSALRVNRWKRWSRRENGSDPMAVRLALLAHHYRSDWEWTAADLQKAEVLLAKLREAVAKPSGAPAGPVVESVLTSMATDLDAPGALIALNTWATATVAGDESDPAAPATIRALTDAALGVLL